VEIADYIQQQQQAVGFYTQQHISEQFARFLNALADYYLRKGMHADGFKYLIESLKKSTAIKISYKSCIIKSVELFERFKKYASSETIATYKNLINEVH
jgi:hypothetical protein